MIDRDAALLHYLFQLSIGDGVGDIPPHAPQNDFLLKMTPLKVDHATTSTLHDQWRSIAEYPSSEKLQQNRLAYPPPLEAPENLLLEYCLDSPLVYSQAVPPR